MNIRSLLIGDISQKELLDYFNASISYESLPRKIQGYVFKYENIYNIVINNNLSYYKKKKTILHELAHIELSHLDREKELFALSINKYEDEADKYIKFLLETC